MKKDLEKKHYKIMKKISNKKLSIKDNLLSYRKFQKIINPIHKHSKYEDILIDLENRKIKIRVFNEFTDNINHKIIIYFHGGGWVSGSIDTYTNACFDLSQETGYIVILVDYRLAPEFPFPCGLDDCYEITRMIVKNANVLRIEQTDIVLMGDSAGGNLAVAVALKAKETKEFKIKKQILLYPALQSDYSISTKYKSIIEKGEDYLLTRQHMEEFMDLYVKTKDDLKNPLVSPLECKNFKKMPETFILVGEHDPLVDECVEYKEKLRKDKVEVELKIYENAVHGFISNVFGIFKRETLYKDINKFLGVENEKKK